MALLLFAGLFLSSGLVAATSADAADTGGYPYASLNGPGSKPADYTWTDSRGSDLSPYRYGYRNCTDFVAWKLDTANGFRVASNYGHAKTWGDVNRKITNTTPAPGSVAWSNAGTYGHVAWVESVSGNTITVQDYNKAGTGAYARRTVNKNEFTGFIHFKDLGTASATPPPGGGGNPFGHLDSLTRAPGGLRAQGWVIDPDTAAPIDAHLYSGNGNPGGGNPGVATRADRDRPDVGRAYPGRGAAHGFDFTVPARAAGTQTGCVYGINVGGGNANPRIGCASINVSPDPYGHLDIVRRVPGGVEASGWSIDPDTGDPIAVHVYGGNGNPGGGPGVPTTANVNRPDVGNVYPNYGAQHGFTVFLPTGPQPQTFCAYGINNGPGANPRLGCASA